MAIEDIKTNKWHIERAIWDEDTGDVAYVLEGIKTADARTQRILNAAPDMYKELENIIIELDKMRPLTPFEYADARNKMINEIKNVLCKAHVNKAIFL